MSDETTQSPVPPCSCIERRDGHWVQYCDCANTGDLAMAQSWCTSQNMIESQRRDPQSAPVPPGWVRLTPCGFAPSLFRADDVRQISPVSGDQSIAEVVTISGGGTLRVAESPAEVAAMIAAAQRAQRRAEALPVMAATVLCPPKIGLVDPRQRYYEAADDALAILDAIEAREAGR